MSILDKPLSSPSTVSHRPLRWIMAMLIPLILLLFLLSFTSVSNDLALIQHFATPPPHFTYSGHHNYVSAVAWSPDGTRIASASGDHTVQVWNAHDGSHVLTYRGHSSDVSALAWSPNGQYIASGSIDATVQIWNARTGQHVFTYRKHTDAIFSLAWSPNGQYLASASNDGSLQVWQALTGTLLFSIQNASSGRNRAVAPWNAVAWSPNGKEIAAGGNGDAMLFDAQSGRYLAAYGYHGGVLHTLAWSPNGQYLAVGEASGSVLVWNVATGNNVYQYNGHSADVYTIAWSPDGTRLASGGFDATVQVWDAFTGQHVYTYRGHADFYPGHFTSGAAVNTVAWSPDGTHIASGSSDTTVQVWPVPRPVRAG